MNATDKAKLEEIKGFFTGIGSGLENVAKQDLEFCIDLIARQEEEIAYLSKHIEAVQVAVIERLEVKIKELISELERLKNVVGEIDFNLIEQVLQKVKGKV